MGLIDVHMHYMTPYYLKEMERAGRVNDHLMALPKWGYDLMMQFMDEVGVTEGILSASSPNQSYGDKAAALDLTRESNESGAGYCARLPGRLGLAIALPLPYVEETLAEIAYGYDVLKCCAVRVLSNSCGLYPGDPSTEPVFAELERRKAVVVLHPTPPPSIPENALSITPIPLYEFYNETARAVITLILSGTVRRYPNIKYIVPHNGALLIPILERAGRLYNAHAKHPDTEPVDIIADAKTLYFDIAGDPFPRQLDTLLTVAAPARIVYGSDFPFCPVPGAAEILKQMQGRPATSKYNDMIFRSNALEIFPQFC